MTKYLSTVAAAAMLIGSASIASAQSANSNRDAALGMRDVLTDPAIGESLGLPSTGAAAPTVSGKDATAPGDSGWGNAGSRGVAGDQVSRGGDGQGGDR